MLLHFLSCQEGDVFEPVQLESLEAVFTLGKLSSGLETQGLQLENQLVVCEGNNRFEFPEFVVGEHLVDKLPIY